MLCYVQSHYIRRYVSWAVFDTQSLYQEVSISCCVMYTVTISEGKHLMLISYTVTVSIGKYIMLCYVHSHYIMR